MIKQVTPIRVRYADTDQMKIVYYAKFFEYFEQGRSDLLRSIGLPYPQIEEMGLLLPVIEAHANYKRAAKYDELLKTITCFHGMAGARVRIEYQIFKDGDTESLADGYTIHSFVSAATGKPTKPPAQFLEAVKKSMNL
jgi:acyl-CoA thioester hydrolase